MERYRDSKPMGRKQKLILEYPWLDTGINNYTLLDGLPIGWTDLILNMCASLKPLLEKYNYLDVYGVAEAKEKYGMLRWYDYLDNDDNMPDDIVELVQYYENVSRNVCMVCGRLKDTNQDMCDLCQERYCQ